VPFIIIILGANWWPPGSRFLPRLLLSRSQPLNHQPVSLQPAESLAMFPSYQVAILPELAGPISLELLPFLTHSTLVG